MQERQALDEVSKDREMVKTEQAAEAAAESSAEQLAARIDKRIAAVDAEVCMLLRCVCTCSTAVPLTCAAVDGRQT